MPLFCDKCWGSGSVRGLGMMPLECSKCLGTKVMPAITDEVKEAKIEAIKEKDHVIEIKESSGEVKEAVVEQKEVKKRGRKKREAVVMTDRVDGILRSLGKIE